MQQLVSSVPYSQKELWGAEIIQYYKALSERKGHPATEEDLREDGVYSIRIINHLFGGVKGLQLKAGFPLEPRRSHRHKGRRAS
jgi:hypothetical protein